MSRRARARKSWAKAVRFYDLAVGDMLFDDDGQLYVVVELAEPKFSHPHDELLIERFRIEGLWNTSYMTGNATPRTALGTFDNRTWVWHSRLGCLIL